MIPAVGYCALLSRFRSSHTNNICIGHTKISRGLCLCCMFPDPRHKIFILLVLSVGRFFFFFVKMATLHRPCGSLIYVLSTYDALMLPLSTRSEWFPIRTTSASGDRHKHARWIAFVNIELSLLS